jgi:hypothetical protein
MALGASPWPVLTGRIGPYGGIRTVQEAEKLSADDFTLTLPRDSTPELLATLRTHGVTYIDAYLWGLIHRTCVAQDELSKAEHQPLHREISELERKVIASDTGKHLEQVGGGPDVAGFWILDDYPGDVSTTLKIHHDLVAQANAAAGLQRPTICGVGGLLDTKQSSREKPIPRRYLDLALTNVSPGACDLVSPYLYANSPGNNPKRVEWSLRKAIPYLLRAPEQKRFNISSPLLLSIIHAFSSSTGYVMPRPEDILAHVKAYSKVRADIALLFFTWQSSDADQSYANNAAIRDGVQQGAAYFRARNRTHNN